MALIKCKECGKEISDQATSCPNCGAKLQTEEQKLIVIVVAIIIIIVSIYFMFKGTSKLLNSDSDDSRLKYDKENDTYTYTIWENKN